MIVFGILFVTFVVSTHIYLVCYHFIWLMLLFYSHAPFGEQAVRALASHQCGPGSKSSVGLVCLGSLPRSEGFLSSGYVGYLLSLKTSSKFQFTRTRFNEVLKTHNCSMSKQITVTKLQLHGAGRNFTRP